jgi:hypothetical protein
LETFWGVNFMASFMLQHLTIVPQRLCGEPTRLSASPLVPARQAGLTALKLQLREDLRMYEYALGNFVYS